MGVEPTLPAWEAGALPLSYRRACGRRLSKIHGGRGGIRTHGRLAPTTVFKTAALDLSATRPRGAYYTIIFGATATASRVAAKKKRVAPVAELTDARVSQKMVLLVGLEPTTQRL